MFHVCEGGDGWIAIALTILVAEEGKSLTLTRVNRPPLHNHTVHSGGENISTIEVENVLHSHPSISEAAVRRNA